MPQGDYEVVYIGFQEKLNYPFVVEHALSSSQIFQYLPGALTFPFTDDDDYDDVSVKRLIPFTASGIDYTITVAEVYFPLDSVNALSKFIQNEDSRLYRNPATIEGTLASLIDNRIPLTGLDTSGVDDDEDDDDSNSNSGSVDGENSTIGNKGKIAGIAVGAAAGGGLYLTLMILLFKRYKKGQALQLPPSDSESNVGMNSTMSQVSSGFSAVFNRAPDSASASDPKSMQISEPVQASNSLGWAH